jgi:hypothetical protein
MEFRERVGMSFSWQGASGRWYVFDVARAKRVWEPLGGIYMFVKPGDQPTMEAGGPVCLFLAATDSFAESLHRHDIWGAANALGASEVHLLEIADGAKRAQVEQDLLKSHTPVLNRQLRMTQPAQPTQAAQAAAHPTFGGPIVSHGPVAGGGQLRAAM